MTPKGHVESGRDHLSEGKIILCPNLGREIYKGFH